VTLRDLASEILGGEILAGEILAGARFWVAQRFSAAIEVRIGDQPYSLLKDSRFVSGHRFSDAVSIAESVAALAAAGCRHEGNEFFSKLFSHCGPPRTISIESCFL
jgi:hypothetical protein